MTPDEVTALVRNELKRALGNDYTNADPTKVIPAGPVSGRAYAKVRDGVDGGPSLNQTNSRLIRIMAKLGIK